MSPEAQLAQQVHQSQLSAQVRHVVLFIIIKIIEGGGLQTVEECLQLLS